MEARVVGGRAALLVWSALLISCESAGPRSPVSDPLAAPPPSTEAPLAGAPSGVPAEPSGTAASKKREVEPGPSRVVLVTLDGVRWEDVFAGAKDSGVEAGAAPPLMRNLQRLVAERGVALGGPGCEHDVRASGPNFVSLPGYLEMFTGKSTACTHNACPAVDTPTVIDEAREAATVDTEIAVFASWGRYARAVARNRTAIVLSAGASTTGVPPARGDAELRSYIEVATSYAGYPGHGDYRPDVHTARIALRYLETKRPRLLVVGLGDADEFAHRGDLAGYRRAMRRADDFVADLDRTLAEMAEEGRETAVLVTTDHGRARSFRGHGASFPESQRVFVAAFGAGVARRGITCAGGPLRLAHVAGAVRSLLALEGEAGPLSAEILAADAR